MIKIIRKLHNKKGFTLVEMLIAVFIFTLALSALMSISARGLKTARQSQKQVIADYLAIEAVEVVRNMRDSAFLRNLGITTWELVFEGGAIFDDEGCFDGAAVCNFYISGSDPILDTCTSCTIYYNEGLFYYFQTLNDANPGLPNVDSGYDRSIEINQVSTGQIIVSVKVSWDGGEVLYTENLFLWQ